MTCNHCKEKMEDLSIESCIKIPILYPDGIKLDPLTSHFKEKSGRCHDCNIVHGGYHHPGCDVEKCPRCEGQLITCGCLSSNKGEEL